MRRKGYYRKRRRTSIVRRASRALYLMKIVYESFYVRNICVCICVYFLSVGGGCICKYIWEKKNKRRALTGCMASLTACVWTLVNDSFVCVRTQFFFLGGYLYFRTLTVYTYTQGKCLHRQLSSITIRHCLLLNAMTHLLCDWTLKWD